MAAKVPWGSPGNACCCCNATEATVVISGAPFPLPAGCVNTLTGGSLEVTNGDINGGYSLTGSSGNLDLAIPDFFDVDEYSEPDCDGDPSEVSRILSQSIRCFNDSEKPLGFDLTIASEASRLYNIYDIGITDPDQRFDFDEEVSLPGGGTLTVSRVS